MVREERACPNCHRPGFLYRAWVPCWPWRALHCDLCGDFSTDMPWLLECLWEWLVFPFWDGEIAVEVPVKGDDDAT